jgi:polar amino acid transport system permease protein/polar amino acid transport system substrate-binding protein
VNYIDRRLRTGRADTSGTLDDLEQAIVVERG